MNLRNFCAFERGWGRAPMGPRGLGVAAMVAAACAASARADLVVDQDLGKLTLGPSDIAVLEGSYLGRPSNASSYYTPSGQLFGDGRTRGEYVYTFTTAYRARFDMAWFTDSFTVSAFRNMMILDSLAVDATGRSSAVRFAWLGTSYTTGPAALDAGRYYVVFDEVPPFPGTPEHNPLQTFRAALSMERLQLSATIWGATSMQNIWPRPYNFGPSNSEDAGFAAAYAPPIPFYVSEAGVYSLANITAAFNFSGMIYVDTPGVGQPDTSVNLIGENRATLQPGRQYYLVVSTLGNVVPVGTSPFIIPATDTPGPFSAQFEGPGVVTLGLIPAPSTLAPLMAAGVLMARRRR